MDSLDFLDQQSDELSFQFLDHSPPRFEDEHAELNVVESNQVEINATITKSNRVPIDESVDDFFDFSPLKFVEGENTQVENPSVDALSVDESFDFSPLNLEGENTQVENPSVNGILNPLSFDECFDFSPLNLERESTQEHPSVDGILNLLSIDESLDFEFDFSPPPPPPPPRVQAGEHAVEWTFDENKEFENALAEFDHSSPNFFEELASRVPSKSISEIKTHYEKLVYDIESIEAGKVELPDYLDNQQPELEAAADGGDDEVAGSPSKEPQGKGKGIAAAEKKKRRGSTAWTEEEHANFLKGLAEYGKGDWRSISRVHVLTKNPTQIASHAQKFFRRQRSSKKSSAAAGAATSSTYPYPRRRRRSIHDIDKVVTPTTTITISTSPPKPDTTTQQAEQSLHTPKPSVDPDLTNTNNAHQNCTSSPPLIPSSTTVSIPLLQSINEEAPFPPLANPHMIPPLQKQAPNFPPPPNPYNMTLPSWITTTTTLIPPRRPRGRPRHNFNPRVHQPPASIPLPFMHLNLPSWITSSTTPAIASIPPWPPRHNFNCPRPVTQKPAISPLMGRLNLTNFRPPILIPSAPRPTVSIPSIRGHHFNSPQIGHQQQYELPPNFPDHLNPPQTYHHQQYELPPVPECLFDADFPPIPLIRHNSNNIPDPETENHDAELPPLPYCNVPFPPPLTSSTPPMNQPPFEQTQSFLSFYRAQSVPCSTSTVRTTASDIPGPSANGLHSSSSSHPPAKIWFERN